MRLVEETEAHVLVGLFLLCGENVSISPCILFFSAIHICERNNGGESSNIPAHGGMYAPSTFSSSAGAAASPPAAAAPPAAGAAAPPPEPTFTSRSFTSLPSRACVQTSLAIDRSMSKGVFARSWRGYFASSYLGEDGGPDGLDAFDASSLDQGLELVGLLHSKSAVYSGESTTKNGHIQCVYFWGRRRR